MFMKKTLVLKKFLEVFGSLGFLFWNYFGIHLNNKWKREDPGRSFEYIFNNLFWHDVSSNVNSCNLYIIILLENDNKRRVKISY